MQELLLKMGGGVYAEVGVFAGFYGILLLCKSVLQCYVTLRNHLKYVIIWMGPLSPT